MAVEVRWTLQEATDVSNIAEYISRDSVFYAQIQTEKFFARTDILREFLQSGRIVPETHSVKLRELIEGSCRIVYRIVSTTQVDVIMVVHGSRLLDIEQA